MNKTMKMTASKLTKITLAGALLASPLLMAEKAEASHKQDAVGNRYELAVDFMAGKGYQGDSAIHFGVAKKVTRADAAEMLAKALELDYENASDSGFKDVSPEDAPYVNALKEAGITNGKTATTFGSDEILTRGQIAVWLTEGYDLESNVQITFTDVAPQYKDVVTALMHHGITNGTTATTYGTYDEAKRGDFAIFLYRADGMKKEMEAEKEYSNASQDDDFFHTESDYGTVGEDGTLIGPGGF